MSFLLVNKILNISLFTKILKKIDFFAYSLDKCLYIKEILIKIDIFIFWQKKEKAFIQYMDILEKVWNIGISSKTFNSELIHCKKYLISFVFKVLKHW